MIKHWKYLVYVLKHKWFVLIECCKLKHPWLGITHDLSKVRWSEWYPYVEHFYGPRAEEYRSGKEDPEFDMAFLHHMNRNPHHWQYWITVNRQKEIAVREMPVKYVEEMLADWKGAARAKGQGGVYTPVWYDRVKESLILGEATRQRVEEAVDHLRQAD